jgi:hypothetical protein
MTRYNSNAMSVKLTLKRAAIARACAENIASGIALRTVARAYYERIRSHWWFLDLPPIPHPREVRNA